MNAKYMVSHVPFLDLNTVKKDKKWQVSSFCACSCSLCASGFLYKMLLKTVASILLLSLDKNKSYLSMIFQLLFKKIWFFLDIIEQFGTRPRSRNTIILLVTRPLPKTHCGDWYVSLRLYCKSNATKWPLSLSLLHWWS